MGFGFGCVVALLEAQDTPHLREAALGELRDHLVGSKGREPVHSRVCRCGGGGGGSAGAGSAGSAGRSRRCQHRCSRGRLHHSGSFERCGCRCAGWWALQPADSRHPMPSSKSLRVREKLGRSRTARGELARDWDGHVPPWDGHVPSQQEGDRREHRNEDQELRRPPGRGWLHLASAGRPGARSVAARGVLSDDGGN